MTRTGRICGSRPAVVFVGALLFAGIVSASINPGAIRRQATATSAEAEASMDFKSLTGCHMHGSTQYVLWEIGIMVVDILQVLHGRRYRVPDRP